MIRFLTNRWIHFLLLFALLLGTLYFSFADTRWRREIQHFVFDSLNQNFPRERSDDILIVDIDDDSLLRLGQWPWPRTTIADVVAGLSLYGAKVIAFDGVLAEPDRSSPHAIASQLGDREELGGLRSLLNEMPDNDQVLANAIQDSGVFVSGFTYGSYTQHSRDPALLKKILIKEDTRQTFLEYANPFKEAATFLPVLEKASAGNGSFMATPDHDGVLRRAGLIFSNGSVLYPSLVLEALRVYQDDRAASIRVAKSPKNKSGLIDTNYRIVLGDNVVPVEDDAKLWVYYRGFDEKRDYFPAYKVLDEAYSDEVKRRVQDKIVFIASSAEGLKDLRNTPLQNFRPGVEIHANMAEQILQGKYLIRPDVAFIAEGGYILIVGLAMILLAPFIHVLLLGAVCVTSIILAFLGSGYAYVESGLLLDPFYPSICAFAIFVVSTLMTFLRVEYERKHVRDAFGLYISPDFMQELTENPDKLKLGGEIRDLTIMFTDIRRFTSISEGLSPEELIQLMNDFLTPMSDLVMKHRGTIDKYMGDAMMAFWNAPLDDAEHAANACRAALKMQAALDPINEQVELRAKEKGEEPILLKAGIGLNTGPCAVGNMGSRQRFAYSTLGDAVNLASRLEGQTKSYDVGILAGESTYDAVPGFAFLELDLLQVKGKLKPVKVYALLGDEEYAQTEEFSAWKSKHDQMIERYREKAFDDALSCLKEARHAAVSEMYEYYDLYDERIQEMIKNPPDGDWNGVYVATSK